MTEDELAEIEKSVKMLEAMGMTWKSRDMCRLIAEVRRQRAENRAMQSRLDIAEGRVEGMKNL